MEQQLLDNLNFVSLFFLLVATGFFIWKCIHFSKNKTSKTSAAGFVFFSEYSITNSNTESRRIFKRTQNTYTRYILLLIIVAIIFYLIYHLTQ